MSPPRVHGAWRGAGPKRRTRPSRPLAFLVLLLCTACAQNAADVGDGVGDGERSLFPDLAEFGELPSAPQESASGEFWDHWGDGHAELSGYRMTIQRYGAAREAELALIYVTEPHDRRTWIKDDDVAGGDRVEVLKLNSTVQFLTGVYPYSVMTSVFAPVDRYREEPFAPVRIAHSVQEWCGAYSHFVWPGRDRFRSLRMSYFAHEGERVSEVDTDRDTLYEDALLVQLRELDGPFAGGGEWEGLLVPELWRLRAGHGGTEPVQARIGREQGVRTAEGREVPVTRFTLTAGEYERVYEVEAEGARRVLWWSTSTGDEAELVGTARLAYWNLNRPGDEAVREELGLSPHGSLPPGGGEGPAGGCPR